MTLTRATGVNNGSYQISVNAWNAVIDRLASVAEYGAIGDGVTDDSAAFQSAHDATGHVYVPPGTYAVSDLRLASNSRITGAGSSLVTLKALPNQDPHVAIIRNATDNPADAASRDTNIAITGLTLDGNKANNASQGEWGHCIEAFAINGLHIDDVVCKDPMGDGVTLSYSFDVEGIGATAHDVGCSNVTLNVRVEGADRQGVALTCAENVTGEIITSGSRYFGLDLEPDSADSFMRNISLKLISYQDGLGAGSSGGFAVAAPGGAENVAIDFAVYEPDGNGGQWRDAKGLALRGSVTGATGNGLVGFDGGTIASTVNFDVITEDCVNTSFAGAETPGATYTGRVVVRGDTGGNAAASLTGGDYHGSLDIRIEGMAQGLQYNNYSGDLYVRSLSVSGGSSHCLWLIGSTNGVRIGRFSATGSTFGAAILEADTADNNRIEHAEITGSYGSGPVTLIGTSSMVEPSSTTGITAFAGGGKASATKLRSKFNVLGTVATAADSVLLPVIPVGESVVVKNSGANAAQVFAPTQTINGVATGTGVSLANGTSATYFCSATGAYLTL